MNNWSPEELAFRCKRLSVRLEILAQTFFQLATLSEAATHADAVNNGFKVLKSAQLIC